MPSAKRDLSQALKERVLLGDRPHIAGTPGERLMPGAKLVAVTRVTPDPTQPRKHFDPESLEGLAQSIRERGILQPLRVRPLGDGYGIIMGERRYRAALLAGLDEVPVIVGEASPEEAFLDALTENVQRANLTDEEEAEAYRGLLAKGYTVRQIAARIGIAPSKVSRVTRIYDDPVLAEAVLDGRITKSQAQELLVAPAKEKPRLVTLVADRRGESERVRLHELRAEVARAREGVALRNTRESDEEPAEPAPPDVGTDPAAQQPAVAVALEREPVLPIAAVAPGLNAAREQAHRLRLDVLEGLTQLAAHASDRQVAAELEMIRDAIVDLTGRGA